ncbi:MAG: universal stress protein [Chitinophagaceae bacterium]
MNTILVPTDFSPTAENAANYAGLLCKELGAKLVLLHVYMLPVPVSEIPYVMVSADEMQKASENALKKETNRLFETMNIEVEWLVQLGLASDEIRDIEKEKNIDLVIMGMNGGGEFDKLIGSTTIAVIRKCHKPVLVIPEGARFVPFRLIAYATDFNYAVNLSFFAPLKSFIKTFKSQLIVVNVQKAGKTLSIEQVNGKEKIEQVLDDTDPQYTIIEDNNIEHGLQQFIEKHSPQLLTMVAHKHNVIERLFGTHHTKEMIYQTNIPILILQDKN